MLYIRCVWEHNAHDTLLYAENIIGAFTRGTSLDEALNKMPREICSYLKWIGYGAPDDLKPVIVQEKESQLKISDADSDVLFDSEREVLTWCEYSSLKQLALKSAADFHRLYESIPDIKKSCLKERSTFYGSMPLTAEEMYFHTRNVNSYYFDEIGVTADNGGSILDCRIRGFKALEGKPDYLSNTVYFGSYNEEWSLRKVLRRFVWHDRIHAKAMWRMAEKTFGHGSIPNIFCF